MKRKFKFSTSEFYHIYNRGNDKRSIFMDSSDKERFLGMLHLCNGSKGIVFREIPGGDTYGFNKGESIVDIGAYCLMPNHFHLLVREKTENGISKFMKKLLTGYSMYFNIKNKRSGKLFEGPFNARHADKDEYLRYLFAYIHLNPVKLIDPAWRKKGIFDFEKSKKYLRNYKYSSYFDYIGINRAESIILNKPEFPEYFTNLNDFEGFTDEWLKFSPRGESSGMDNLEN